MIAYLTFLLAATGAATSSPPKTATIICADGKTVQSWSLCPENTPIITASPPPSDPQSSYPQSTYPPPPSAFPARPTPKGNPSYWVATSDYQSLAMMNEWQGTTGIRLDIGVDGRVSNCVVTQSSGYGLLDDETCKIIKRRARFNPALDEVGKAVASTYSKNIRWALPDGDIVNPPVTWATANVLGAVSPRGPNKAPDPIGMQKWLSFEPFASKWAVMDPADFILQVNAAGKPEKCIVDPTYPKNKSKEYGAALCKALMARATFEPATDTNGYKTSGSFVASTYLLRTIDSTVTRTPE